MNERIKILRNELGLSLTAMGHDLNVTASSISLLENGKRNITERTIADLERVYNVNPEWLKTGEGNMFNERTREIEIAEITATMFKSVETDIRYQLMRIVSQMTEEQLETFRDVAKQLVENTEVK